MSVPVDIEALRERISEFGDRAFLVTVSEDHRPHVVSVAVRQDGDHLMVVAGRRTAANLAARRTATLLWPPATTDGEYSLLVDGIADAPVGDSGDVAIVAASAMLHRVAGASGDGPTCLPVSSD